MHRRDVLLTALMITCLLASWLTLVIVKLTGHEQHLGNLADTVQGAPLTYPTVLEGHQESGKRNGVPCSTA